MPTPSYRSIYKVSLFGFHFYNWSLDCGWSKRRRSIKKYISWCDKTRCFVYRIMKWFFTLLSFFYSIISKRVSVWLIIWHLSFVCGCIIITLWTVININVSIPSCDSLRIYIPSFAVLLYFFCLLLISVTN